LLQAGDRRDAVTVLGRKENIKIYGIDEVKVVCHTPALGSDNEQVMNSPPENDASFSL
jgi:hypothetical protein